MSGIEGARPYDALVLDLEGTICTISFVRDVLFPYASKRTEAFLRKNLHEPHIKEVIARIRADSAEEIAKGDRDVRSIGSNDEAAIGDIAKNVKYWTKKDLKIPGMKELQGHIWKEGYASGDLTAELFPDVMPVLKQLLVPIYTYSSGSREAQEQFLRHTKEGDAALYIRYKFSLADIGHKREHDSYVKLADAIGKPAQNILFVTDIEEEAAAARTAGMRALLMIRPGNLDLTQFARDNFECAYNLAAVLTKEDIERCYSLRQTPESDLLRAAIKSYQACIMSRADEGRLIHLAKRRERAKEDIELQKQKLEEERAKTLNNDIDTKFTANYDALEETIKSRTVGLVTLEEMRDQQRNAVHQRVHEVAQAAGETTKKDEKKQDEGKATKREIVKKPLSFAFDDDEEEDGEPIVIPKKRLGMDPSVDTSFLPDKDRELEMARKKQQLAHEWHMQQEKEKNEEITVAYAYWDGSSHRKNIRVKRGLTIAQFLLKAIDALRKDFSELKTITPEGLMFVKEDLIIPHFHTFQDFIVSKKMGKTGPLYIFDAVAEIRIRQDAALDSGESHPAKVVLRSWYERNKHIYPASRWEPFSPNKEYKRTIDDLSTI
eukprot:PDM72049.1 hydrolase [Pristionchus pacificus]